MFQRDVGVGRGGGEPAGARLREAPRHPGRGGHGGRGRDGDRINFVVITHQCRMMLLTENCTRSHVLLYLSRRKSKKTLNLDSFSLV